MVNISYYSLARVIADVVETTLMVFDDRWGLIGSASCQECDKITWTSNFLLAGQYKVFWFSHTKWESKCKC